MMTLFTFFILIVTASVSAVATIHYGGKLANKQLYDGVEAGLIFGGVCVFAIAVMYGLGWLLYPLGVTLILAGAPWAFFGHRLFK